MGLEYKFLSHWSTKLEYNFIDFGNQTVNFPISVGITGVAIPAPVAAALALEYRSRSENISTLLRLA